MYVSVFRIIWLVCCIGFNLTLFFVEKLLSGVVLETVRNSTRSYESAFSKNCNYILNSNIEFVGYRFNNITDTFDVSVDLEYIILCMSGVTYLH